MTYTKWISLLSLTWSLGGGIGHAGDVSGNFNGADLDSLRRADLAVYDPPTGNWYIRALKGPLMAFGENWGWNQANPAPGDYNGDGRADLAVYDRATGSWFIKTLGDNKLLAFAMNWGDATMISVPADYDGDGTTDLAVYQQATGNWYIKTMDNRLLAFAVNWGGPDMTPVPADYDGDGGAELAVYQRHTGNWYIRKLGGEPPLAFGVNWGNKRMRPVPGDYNGDGRADLAVYEQATGQWLIRSLDDDQFVLFSDQWGWGEACPVPGDYDGDGSSDLAVYHRATGNWYIRTVGGAVLAFGDSWGLPGRTVPTAVYAHRGTEGRTLICLGDSITYGESSATDGPSTGYPALLERKLDVYLGGHFTCMNFGKSRERTSDGRIRLPLVLNDNPAGDILLLMEGTNDALSDSMFSITQNNLRAMVLSARSAGLKTVLATIPPVISNSSRNRDVQAARIRSFNPRIYSIATETGASVARVYEYITSVRGWSSSLIDQVTANHPNDRGYLRVRDAFYDKVAPLVQSGQ